MSERAPLVDFLVIGAMKSMTTSLLATLDQHPEVAAATMKEAQYFVGEVGWRLGPAWYESLFAHARPGQLRGEASPQYTFFPLYDGVPARIAEVAPSAGLVYLVRDPVERTVSHWRHARARGLEQRPLATAVLSDSRYQLPSRYWLQLEQYFAHFSDEQLLIVDSDRLATDPAAVLREICLHIGADPEGAPRSLARLNVAAGRRVRPTVARARRLRSAARLESRIRQRAPQRVAAAWDAVTTVPDGPVEADDDLAARLRAIFAADMRRLAQHLGPAAPPWAREV